MISLAEYDEACKEIEEYKERLRLVYELASDTLALKQQDVPTGVHRVLSQLRDAADVDQYSLDEVYKILIPPNNKDPEDKIVISCDASITRNPGGETAVGFVIRFPKEDKLEPIEMSKPTPSSTNNEGEYDAIYEALVFLFNHHNRPRHEILVRSDSRLVVKQLLGEWTVNNSSLQKKRDAIHELVHEGPAPVQIEWHPRNSTPDLTKANFLAQDELGVKRH